MKIINNSKNTAKILLHSLKTAKERTLKDLGLKHTQTILKGGKHRGQAKTAVTSKKPLLIYSLTLHVLPSLHFLFKLNFCSLYVLRELSSIYAYFSSLPSSWWCKGKTGVKKRLTKAEQNC